MPWAQARDRRLEPAKSSSGLKELLAHDSVAQGSCGNACGRCPDLQRTFQLTVDGCVRVQDPVALAEWALKGQEAWDRDRILAAMNPRRPQRVNLNRPIQVILFYITAVVMPDDGSIHFAEDIYGHDTKLARALERREMPK